MIWLTNFEKTLSFRQKSLKWKCRSSNPSPQIRLGQTCSWPRKLRALTRLWVICIRSEFTYAYANFHWIERDNRGIFMLRREKTRWLSIVNLKFRAKLSWIEDKSVCFNEKQKKFRVNHTNSSIFQHPICRVVGTPKNAPDWKFKWIF